MSFANIWYVCMRIAIDMFIALLGITWSLSCGIWLCMHMLCFGFYCVSFLSLTSPINIWCMDCFKIVPWELLQLPNGFTRLKPIENQWIGARFYVFFFNLHHLCVFVLFCLLFGFLLMLREGTRFWKKERHNMPHSAWEWYGRSSGTQLHPLKIVSTHAQSIFLRDPHNFFKVVHTRGLHAQFFFSWVVPTNSHAHMHMGMRNITGMMDWKGGDFCWWKNECVNSFFKWLKLSALVWKNDMKLMIGWKGMGIWWDDTRFGLVKEWNMKIRIYKVESIRVWGTPKLIMNTVGIGVSTRFF